MSVLGHLGALLIRLFGLVLAAVAVAAGYYVGKGPLDSTLALFNQGRYGAAVGIAVATGLPIILALILSIVALKRSNWDDEQSEEDLRSETGSSPRGAEYRNWRVSVGALLFVAGSGFVLWVSYEAVTMVERVLIFGDNLTDVRRCNWVCWLSKTEWGKWGAIPFLGFIWWILGNMAVGLASAGCAWLIASSQRELAGVYVYFNRVIRE